MTDDHHAARDADIEALISDAAPHDYWRYEVQLLEKRLAHLAREARNERDQAQEHAGAFLRRLGQAERERDELRESVAELADRWEHGDITAVLADASRLSKLLERLAGRGEQREEWIVSLDLKFTGEIIKNKDGSVVPSDQWVVFLAKDNAFPAALDTYLEECMRLGASPEQVGAVAALRGRVALWREQHPDLCKVPDVEPGELRDR